MRIGLTTVTFEDACMQRLPEQIECYLLIFFSRFVAQSNVKVVILSLSESAIETGPDMRVFPQRPNETSLGIGTMIDGIESTFSIVSALFAM